MPQSNPAIFTNTTVDINGYGVEVGQLETKFARNIFQNDEDPLRLAQIFLIIPGLPEPKFRLYSDLSDKVLLILKQILDQITKSGKLYASSINRLFVESELHNVIIPIVLPRINAGPISLEGKCALDVLRVVSRHNHPGWRSGVMNWENDQPMPPEIDVGHLADMKLSIHEEIQYHPIREYLNSLLNLKGVRIEGRLEKRRIYIDPSSAKIPDWLEPFFERMKNEVDASVSFTANNDVDRFSFIDKLIPRGDPDAGDFGGEKLHKVGIHPEDLSIALALLCLAINEGAVVV